MLLLWSVVVAGGQSELSGWIFLTKVRRPGVQASDTPVCSSSSCGAGRRRIGVIKKKKIDNFINAFRSQDGNIELVNKKKFKKIC